MTEMTGPELFEQTVVHVQDAVYPPSVDTDEFLMLAIAQIHATNAQTAALVMLTEVICTATGVNHYDLDAWREVILLAPKPTTGGTPDT